MNNVFLYNKVSCRLIYFKNELLLSVNSDIYLRLPVANDETMATERLALVDKTTKSKISVCSKTTAG